MAFKLNGSPLAVDVAFKTSDGTQYPANWLRLSTADEKTALGITEVADDPVYDSRFYTGDGTAKALDDKTETVDGEEIKTIGVKSILKSQEKHTAGSLLARYDWYVVRKAENLLQSLQRLQLIVMLSEQLVIQEKQKLMLVQIPQL